MFGVIAAALLATQPARALSTGPGLQFITSTGTVEHVGAYLLDGKRVYCVQANSGSPRHIPDDTPRQGSTDLGLPANTAAAVNWLISTHGMTENPIGAFTVQLAVWKLTNQLLIQAHAMRYTGEDERDAAAFITRRLNPDLLPDVLATYDRLLAGAATIVANAPPGSGTIQVATDRENPRRGAAVVSVTPATARGTVTLQNAVFADTGQPTKADVGAGEYPIRAIEASAGTPFRVTARGTFTGEPSWAPTLAWYPNRWQNLVGAGDPGTTTFTAKGEDTVERRLTFRPVVRTTVPSALIAPEHAFEDTVTFDVVPGPGDAGNAVPWPQDETHRYLPVTAVGRLYGPTPEPLAEADTPPDNIPIARDNVRVTTTATDGPTRPYTVTVPEAARAAGWYTWVWRIDTADQSPATARALPDDYTFHDRFGLAAEAVTVPMALAITTRVVALSSPDHAAAPGATIVDEVSVTLPEGRWHTASGTPVPVVVTGRAYFTAHQPTPSDTVPSDAEPVGGPMRLTFTGPGVQRHAITAPLRAGWLTFQWCVESQEGRVMARCDRFGLPSETVSLVSAPPTPLPSTNGMSLGPDGVRVGTALGATTLTLGTLAVAVSRRGRRGRSPHGRHRARGRKAQDSPRRRPRRRYTGSL